ncbi:MAG: galactose-binding domain-containing protein, partial [Planctomycetota bacterium]
MSKRFLIMLLLITGIIAANATAQIDPATVTTGHVYLFDNVSGSQVPDDSANSNTGTIVGNPQVVDGLSGKALQFDGIDDGVNIPDSQYINVTGGPFPNRTVIAVFNCADVTKQEKQTVFEEGGRTRGLTIYVFDGEVYVGGWNRAEYNWNPGSWLSAPIGSNEWHAVAFVIRDGGEAQEENKFEMWMDGVLIGKAPGGQIHNHSNDNAIGYTLQNNVFHDDSGSGNGWYFEGIIDELWILNDALTPAQLGTIGPRPTKAKNPVPANEAIDVLRDGILTWEASKFAQTHDVYFGTAFDDVNNAGRGNPMDVLASQDQTATTYDPGRLELGQTYYWRVDEVNGPPDYTVYQGDVWSFMTEPVGYAIENITTSASSSQPSREPENTVNGSGMDDSGLLHGKEGDNNMWLSDAAGPQPAWIEYEFDKVYSLHEMWVWNANESMEPVIGFGFKDVTIEYSTNGTDYMTLGTTHEFARGTGMPYYAHNTTIDFGGVGAKYVRLTANSNWGGILPQFGLSEVRFLYIPVQAREPYPPDGATDVSIGTIPEPVDVVLGFRAGREAATHDVYLSTDEQAVIDGTAPVTTVTEASYGPLSVDLGQTYYWRVDEVNEAETPTTWQGDIWDFTVQEYFVVDDFESYNELDPADPNSNRIFLTWLD